MADGLEAAPPSPQPGTVSTPALGLGGPVAGSEASVLGHRILDSKTSGQPGPGPGSGPTTVQCPGPSDPPASQATLHIHVHGAPQTPPSQTSPSPPTADTKARTGVMGPPGVVGPQVSWPAPHVATTGTSYAVTDALGDPDGSPLSLPVNPVTPVIQGHARPVTEPIVENPSGRKVGWLGALQLSEGQLIIALAELPGLRGLVLLAAVVAGCMVALTMILGAASAASQETAWLIGSLTLGTNVLLAWTMRNWLVLRTYERRGSLAKTFLREHMHARSNMDPSVTESVSPALLITAQGEVHTANAEAMQQHEDVRYFDSPAPVHSSRQVWGTALCLAVLGVLTYFVGSAALTAWQLAFHLAVSWLFSLGRTRDIRDSLLCIIMQYKGKRDHDLLARWLYNQDPAPGPSRCAWICA